MTLMALSDFGNPATDDGAPTAGVVEPKTVEPSEALMNVSENPGQGQDDTLNENGEVESPSNVPAREIAAFRSAAFPVVLMNAPSVRPLHRSLLETVPIEWSQPPVQFDPEFAENCPPSLNTPNRN